MPRIYRGRFNLGVSNAARAAANGSAVPGMSYEQNWQDPFTDRHETYLFPDSIESSGDRVLRRVSYKSDFKRIPKAKDKKRIK